jgi:hypothetical protein
MPPQALWFDWFETLVTVFDPSPAAQWWPAPTVPLQSLFSLVRSAGRRDGGGTQATLQVAALGGVGSRIWKAAPSPSTPELSTQMRPPIAVECRKN